MGLESFMGNAMSAPLDASKGRNFQREPPCETFSAAHAKYNKVSLKNSPTNIEACEQIAEGTNFTIAFRVPFMRGYLTDKRGYAQVTASLHVSPGGRRSVRGASVTVAAHGSYGRLWTATRRGDDLQVGASAFLP